MNALTGAQRGFLLLCSHLGNPARKPLTAAQFRELTQRASAAKQENGTRDLQVQDLLALGYGDGFARHIVALLQEEPVLDWYLSQGRRQGCVPLTRASQDYPLTVRKRLGLDSPGCLWAKGDLSVLDLPGISLVGSRELREANRDFAREAGFQAARQGLVLISGNARGADRTAQNACLEAGGKVISIVADSLAQQEEKENLLYLSEDGFQEEFSAQRALSRNRVIHTLGRMVFVAQSDVNRGGTWDGTVNNLRHGWSPVACFRDGSEAASRLEQLGACLVDKEDLSHLSALKETQISFFGP